MSNHTSPTAAGLYEALAVDILDGTGHPISDVSTLSAAIRLAVANTGMAIPETDLDTLAANDADLYDTLVALGLE